MKCTESFAVRYARPEQPAVAHTSLDCLNRTIELRIRSLRRDKDMRMHMTPEEARQLGKDLCGLAEQAELRGYESNNC